MIVKSLLFVLGFLVLFSFSAWGQREFDSLYYGRIGRKFSFYTNTQNLSLLQATEMMKDIPVAKSRLQTGKIYAGVGYAFLSLGGGIVVYSATNSIIKKENVDVQIISLGLSLAMLSSYFQYLKKKNFAKAAEAYDAASHLHSRRNIHLNIGLTGNGLGVKLKF